MKTHHNLVILDVVSLSAGTVGTGVWEAQAQPQVVLGGEALVARAGQQARQAKPSHSNAHALFTMIKSARIKKWLKISTLKIDTRPVAPSVSGILKRGEGGRGGEGSRVLGIPSHSFPPPLPLHSSPPPPRPDQSPPPSPHTHITIPHSGMLNSVMYIISYIYIRKLVAAPAQPSLC